MDETRRQLLAWIDADRDRLITFLSQDGQDYSDQHYGAGTLRAAGKKARFGSPPWRTSQPIPGR
jgi:hypothetical protein